MTHYAMVIDQSRCLGCHTCSVACKTINNLPKTIWYNSVSTIGGNTMEAASGEYPNLQMSYLPKACQHCIAPACVEVCPTGASVVNADGIVEIDAETCIGCKTCISACPYEVRVLIEDEPAYYVEQGLGDDMAPAHLSGKVEKCNFCYQRIATGGIPACMDLCPTRARYWGDLDDAESDISKLLAKRNSTRLLEDQGTEPSVYYLK